MDSKFITVHARRNACNFFVDDTALAFAVIGRHEVVDGLVGDEQRSGLLLAFPVYFDDATGSMHSLSVREIFSCEMKSWVMRWCASDFVSTNQAWRASVRIVDFAQARAYHLLHLKPWSCEGGCVGAVRQRDENKEPSGILRAQFSLHCRGFSPNGQSHQNSIIANNTQCPSILHIF